MKAKKRIIEDLVKKIENSNDTWVKTWVPLFPENYRGTGYSGINFVNLLFAGGLSNKWLTFKQATQAGLKIKKGAKGQYVTYAAKREKEDGKDYYFLKGYYVFNLSDTENFEHEKVSFELSHCKSFVDKFADLYISENLAECYYIPARHVINVPPASQFKNEASYFAVMFHELAHSTKKACPRNFDYATEELTAELCAFFLCVKFGISEEIKANTISYLKHWLKGNNPEKLYEVAKEAYKAFDYLVSFKREKELA